MNCFSLTNKKISEIVTSRLKEKGWTIRNCVEAYNSFRESSESYKELPPLNKDLVCRVKNNKFDVANDRVAKLCDFLGVDLTPEQKPSGLTLQNEYEKVDAVLQLNPDLKPLIKSLLGNVVEIATSSKGA